jgi:hypothetical protein
MTKLPHFLTIGLGAGRPLHPGRCRILVFVGSYVDPRAKVRLEGFGVLKNPMTSSGHFPSVISDMTAPVVWWS